MNDTEITKGQLRQLFEIEDSLTRLGMRGLRRPFQDLLDAHKGRAGNHRVEPAYKLWGKFKLPGYEYFEDYLETIPADPLVMTSELERICGDRALVDPRYTAQQLAQTIKLPNAILRDLLIIASLDKQPYWIACGFVEEDEAARLIRENRVDSNFLVRPMTALEGLCWYLQHAPELLRADQKRIQLAGSVGTLPCGREVALVLVIGYPWVNLVTEELDQGKPFVCGICVARVNPLS